MDPSASWTVSTTVATLIFSPCTCHHLIHSLLFFHQTLIISRQNGLDATITFRGFMPYLSQDNLTGIWKKNWRVEVLDGDVVQQDRMRQMESNKNDFIKSKRARAIQKQPLAKYVTVNILRTPHTKYCTFMYDIGCRCTRTLKSNKKF